MDNNSKSITASRSTKRSKQKEEGSNTHREEDREAKRKARSSGTAAPVPGAHASNGEHKSRTKSGKRSSDDSKSRSRSRKSDEKSDYRSSPRSSASVPGAQAEFSSPRSRSKKHEKSSPRSSRGPVSIPGAQAKLTSPRSRSKRDLKGKERPPRGSRASKPGAEASTPSRDTRSKAKSSGRNNKENDMNVAPDKGPPQFNEDGETVVAAMIVEEEKEDEDAKKERSQSRIREIEAENQRLREEREQKEAKRQENETENEEKKKKKKKKRNMIVCVVLVLVIGGGVSAFFSLQGASSSDTLTQTTDKEEETSLFGPSPHLSTLPTVSPSVDLSSAPTNVPMKYEQPSLEECERAVSGLPIDGESEMFDRGFAIAMEVDLLEGNDIDTRVPELESQIKKLLVPDLIGCDRDFFNNRRLGRHHDDDQAANHNNPSISMSAHPRRQLQSARIRYAIAKAIATVTVTDNACEKSGSPNCRVVTANLDLKVRGEEQVIFLAGVIGEVFPNGVDIRPDLELGTPFEAVVIGTISSLDPTTAPTVAPTGIASENPSGAPSSSPSTSPTTGPDVIGTSAPVIAPSNPPVPVLAPTKAPTLAPSQAPSLPATFAPTPTPPPTRAPQPGLTPQPTPPPTASPTIAPSESPSRSPSTKPSVTPSVAPSTKPSVTPSLTPTIQTSAVPSPAPSSGPSNGPTTSRPSSGPTNSPTSSPTASPTASTPRLGFVPLLRQGMTFEQSTSHPSFPADYAFDGAYNTFSHTSDNHVVGEWWRVNLQSFYGQTVTVNKVTVWNRHSCCQFRLEGAVVKLYGVGSDNLIATSVPLTCAQIQTVDFGEVTGVQSVQVHQESQAEPLHMGEIEVWGSIPNDLNNLGYAGLIKEGMYVEQSSLHSNAGIAYDAAFAIDGDYDTFFHTNQADPNNWWRANLLDFYGQLVTVNKVTVWNRANCSVCPGRLAGATVQLYGAGTDNLIVQSAPLTSALVQTVDFGEVTGVQYIRVHLARVDYLHFTEIEAWGKVP